MYELKKEISQACPAKRGHTPRKKIQKRCDTITDSKIHEFEEALGDGEGQGSLACYRPWGHQESDNNNQKSRRSNTGNSKSIPQGSGKESVQGDSSAADAKGYWFGGTMWQEERAVTVMMLVATVLSQTKCNTSGWNWPVFSVLGLTPLHALLPGSAETSIITHRCVSFALSIF